MGGGFVGGGGGFVGGGFVGGGLVGGGVVGRVTCLVHRVGYCRMLRFQQ